MRLKEEEAKGSLMTPLGSGYIVKSLQHSQARLVLNSF